MDGRMNSRRMFARIAVAFSALILLIGVAAAEETTPGSVFGIETETHDTFAPVTLDGQPLFRVHGISGYPAARRAQVISERVAELAADRTVSPDSLAVIDEAGLSRVVAGDRPVMTVFDAGAAAEGVSRQRLAESIRTRIAEGIRAYRLDRDPRVLLAHAGYALGATLAAVLLFLGLRHTQGWLAAGLERRLKGHLEKLEAHAHQLVQAKHLWMALQGLYTTLYVVSGVLLAYLWLAVVLDLFPWTRPLAQQLIEMFVNPLRAMALGFLGFVPDLVFLGILFVVVRYLLKLIGLFFQGVERGAITIANFEREWAIPTFKIVRLLVVILALVVAYPYIPGSGSDAFKGLSIFLGVIFSLGSSSIIGNLIAGYTMIYRRAFRIGDRIQVGDIRGDVTETRLLVTHIRTIKNEEIIVPNSVILNSHVINYSTLAKSRGLILHATVGIGYETPWRQVDEMLKLAAERTPGLLRDPAPFVLKKSLGDVAVTYEINAYTGDSHGMNQHYTMLHGNILDVFNEYGVQIMTPSYEEDPEHPKVVPKEKWYLAPAVKPSDVSGDKP
jgi:small-conductance mechanosensitive channel